MCEFFFESLCGIKMFHNGRRSAYFPLLLCKKYSHILCQSANAKTRCENRCLQTSEQEWGKIYGFYALLQMTNYVFAAHFWPAIVFCSHFSIGGKVRESAQKCWDRKRSSKIIAHPRCRKLNPWISPRTVYPFTVPLNDNGGCFELFVYPLFYTGFIRNTRNTFHTKHFFWRVVSGWLSWFFF